MNRKVHILVDFFIQIDESFSWTCSIMSSCSPLIIRHHFLSKVNVFVGAINWVYLSLNHEYFLQQANRRWIAHSSACNLKTSQYNQQLTQDHSTCCIYHIIQMWKHLFLLLSLLFYAVFMVFNDMSFGIFLRTDVTFCICTLVLLSDCE